MENSSTSIPNSFKSASLNNGAIAFNYMVQQIYSDNLYHRLNLTVTATEKDIDYAYKNRIRLVHPDKCKREDANRLFIRVKEAYDCLSNSTSRRQYDQWLNSDISDITTLETDSIHSDDSFTNNSDPLFEGDLPVNREFKDDFFIYYFLKYKTVNIDNILYPGFDHYLSAALSVYNIKTSDVHEKHISYLNKMALVNISLKSTYCGFCSRNVYLALPLEPFINDTPSVMYGETWTGPLKILKHPSKKNMRPLLPDHDRIFELSLALKKFLSDSR